MAKRRDKTEMLRRAFVRVGFTCVYVRSYGAKYMIDFDTAPDDALGVIRRMGLYNWSGDASANYVIVRWRVAFERWYQEEVGTDG